MYEPTKQIDQFLIAGFRYHDGADVLDKLEVGTKRKRKNHRVFTC